MNPPNPDRPDALLAALKRDAARIQEPPFDAALHAAAMRRIRALNDNDRAAPWRPALAWASAFVALTVCVALWLPRGAQNRVPPPRSDFSAVLTASRAATSADDLDGSTPLPIWMSPTASLLDPVRPSAKRPQNPL